MKGFYVYVSDQNLVNFALKHEETVSRTSQGRYLLDWIKEGHHREGIKEAFFDYEPMGSDDWGIYGMIADVMTLETGIPFHYVVFDDEDKDDAIYVSDFFFKMHPEVLGIMAAYIEEINGSLMLEEIRAA